MSAVIRYGGTAPGALEGGLGGGVGVGLESWLTSFELQQSKARTRIAYGNALVVEYADRRSARVMLHPSFSHSGARRYVRPYVGAELSHTDHVVAAPNLRQGFSANIIPLAIQLRTGPNNILRAYVEGMFSARAHYEPWSVQIGLTASVSETLNRLRTRSTSEIAPAERPNADHAR